MKKFISDNYKLSSEIRQILNEIYKILILNKSQFDTKNKYATLSECFNECRIEGYNIESDICQQFGKTREAYSKDKDIFNRNNEWIKKLEISMSKLIINCSKYLFEVTELERVNDFLKNRFS